GTDDLGHATGPGDGINVLAGSAVTWTYKVTNNGNVDLVPTVTDDKGTPGNTADDFSPAQVLSGGFNVGDTNHDTYLSPGETWQYTASGTAQVGAYNNIATVNGVDPLDSGETAKATDPSSYFGQNPAINIEKVVSGDGGS